MNTILPKTKLISIGSKLLAGMSISVGAYVNCKVGGPLGAVLFCIGLISVITFGFELYTGWIRKFEGKSNQLLHLATILLFNIIGCIIVALSVSDPQVIEKCNSIVLSRADMGFWKAIFNGCGCGFIITLAVMSENKFALLLGIPAFILAGFTHSIADAFYYAVGYTNITWQAIATYIGTVLGNFVGGIIYKVGTEKR